MSKEKVGKEKSVKKIAAKSFMEKRAAKAAKREGKRNGEKTTPIKERKLI